MENYDIKDYVWLRSLVVARLTLYNARRGEEAARMTLEEWADACAGVWIPNEHVEQIVDPGEQFLVGQYRLAYLHGKGRKYVPVLVPMELTAAMNVLNRDRNVVGIDEKNIFLFATRNSMSHCSGWHAVAGVCKRANIDLPVNATKLRHRLSSLFASLDMTASDKKIFMDHMGHDEEINKENYQCPPGVQALRVMGKMLTDADKGVVVSQRHSEAKKLHENPTLVAQSIGDLSDSEESDREKIVEHAATRRKIAKTDNFSEYLSNGELPDSESEDEVIGGKNTEKCAVIPRKNARIKNVPVKWSETDTGVVRHTFRSYVYTETDKQNCKGSLPSKEEILRFINENHLESLNNLTQ